MSKYIIFAIMIFPLTFTGCGDDDGGGGKGNNGPGGSKTTPVRKVGVRSFGQVSAGGSHTCALTSGGGVKCWGEGTNGRLGNGSNNNLNLPGAPVQDSGGNPLTGIVQVSSGGKHVCALTAESEVLCWGAGTLGQLGNDASVDSNHAVVVVDGDNSTDPLTGIIQISAGGELSCALTSEGRVFCWGAGAFGQLGNGDILDKDHPVAVVASANTTNPLTGIVQIGAAGVHTCALKSGGEVVCWGYGFWGRLGNGAFADKSHPVPVITAEGDSTPLDGIVQISAGASHTCALTSLGGVKCWGLGAYGKLGNGSIYNQNAPVDVLTAGANSDKLTGIVQIVGGVHHACALTSMGGVKCWGEGGRNGNDKNNDSLHPVTVVAGSGSPFALSGVVEVTLGFDHACALISDGEIFCWGGGGDGRLGNNATDTQFAPVKVVADASDTPFNVGVWRREYRCWEDDGTCEINPDSLLRPVLTGSREGASATPAVKVLGVEEGEEVSLHLDANCSGESIGDGTVAAEADEITITPDTDLVAKENRIYAKVGSLCSASGADYTYTSGTDRVAGDGEEISTDRTPTLTVKLLSNGDEVSIHKSADCSDTVLASGTATGASLDVTLSDLGSIGSHTLYLKQGDVCHPRGFGYKLANYIGEPSRVAGGEDYACAVTNAGGVKCWGEGGNGQLGNNGTADTDAPDDVDTDGSDTLLFGIVQVATGAAHACALTSAGGVKCWGTGANGRLGNDCDASCTDSNISVDVKSSDGSSSNLSGIVQVSAGEFHTCALTSMGGVKCWGAGTTGELGNNTNTDKDTPVNVVTSNSDSNPLSSIVQISAGSYHTCALTIEGNVKCWGASVWGQLGNDCNSNCNNKLYPVDVVASGGNSSPLSGIVQISSGGPHTCALNSGGNVVCWGYGADGQLGNGATSAVDAPVTVTSSGSNALTGIARISLGSSHSCALKSAGGVVCWGEGDNGRLGNNTAGTDQTRPVNVLTSAGGNPALASIAQIGLGNAHSCAVTTAGAVTCWGHGDVGQLGNDATIDANTPVDVKNENGGSGVLNIGIKNRYACGDVRCAFIDN